MSATGHSRGPSGGQHGLANGSWNQAAGSLPPVWPSVDDLQRKAGSELQATVNTSFEVLLNQLRQCNQQIKSYVSFKRPDRAYIEFHKGAELLRMMRQHRELPFLRSDKKELFLAVERDHQAQMPMLREIESIIEDNPPQLPLRSNGHPPPPPPRHQPSAPNGTSGTSGSRPSSQAGPKRAASGPHDELHLHAGLPNGSMPSTHDPLVARFAQLRSPSGNSGKLPYPVDDSSLRNPLNGSVPNGAEKFLPAINHAPPAPDGRLYGPRSMPSSRSDTPPPPPKIPLDSALASLPRAPSPIYSPSRAPPGTTFSSQRHTPRSSVDSVDYRLSSVSSRSSQSPQQNRRREINDTRPPLPNVNSISAEQLLSLFKSYQILVIDVRPRELYDDGHIHAKSVICIEPLSLRFGNAFEELRDNLVYSPDSEIHLLDRLSEYDLVVYYDQRTASDSFLSGPPHTTVAPALRYLYDTMTEFNYSLPPRRQPCFLVGGLDAWVDLVGPHALQITQAPLVPRSQLTPKPARRPTHRVSLTGQNSSREIRQRRMRGYDPLNPDEERAWRETARKEEERPANIQDYQVESDSESGQNLPYPSSSTIHNLEDFFRRFPEPSDIPASMVVPKQSIVAPRPSVPPAPSRPAPAAPRQSYRGESEGGSSQQATSIRPSASSHPPRYTSRFLLQSLKLPRTGLGNFGVTCYMNATIQCLSATIPLSRFFLEDSWRNYVQKNWKGSNGIMPEIYSNLIRGLWKNEQTAIRPVSLRSFCARLNPEWGVDRQQDAKEFFDFLIDCLHEDLNVHWNRHALRPLTTEEELRREEMPSSYVSKVEWDRYSHREFSFPSNLFAGQHASRLRCTKCGHTSTTYEAFFSISVEIPRVPPRTTLTLPECLRSYCQEERLAGDEEWRCPRCRRAREATKRLRITRLPQVLVVHLKRFAAGRAEGIAAARKVHTPVDFPLRSLDMEPYTLDARPAPPGRPGDEQYPDDAVTPPFLYDAFGVLRHIGSTGNGGHYVALVKDGARGVWRKFDDDRVADVDPTRLRSQDRLQNEQAYIVFYERAKPR